MKTKCPMSGKPLRLKDLIPVHFTLADKHSSVALEARQERYICAASHKPLRNAVPCCVLRPSGRVITVEAYERLVKGGAFAFAPVPVSVDALLFSLITDAPHPFCVFNCVAPCPTQPLTLLRECLP